MGLCPQAVVIATILSHNAEWFICTSNSMDFLRSRSRSAANDDRERRTPCGQSKTRLAWPDLVLSTTRARPFVRAFEGRQRCADRADVSLSTRCPKCETLPETSALLSATS